MLEKEKCGKWMYFFNDLEFAKKICIEAVLLEVVAEAKHTDGQSGVCCFYCNDDDINANKKIIQFFLNHNLILKTKEGKFKNISFKYDNQTRAGLYNKNFHGKIQLENYIDLKTGEWKV